MTYRHLDFPLLIIVFTAICLWPHPAQAYLDPGNGSYFIQIVIAASLGGLVTARVFLGRIKKTIGRLFSRRENKSHE